MYGSEFARWHAAEIESYAAEMVEAGMLDPDAALERSKQQTAEFLPDGLRTARMRLLRVLDDAGAAIGVLWVGPHPRRDDAGFVYDVEIEEHRRGEGFGRRAMLAAERIAREAGWTEIGLNVFGPNARARALYDSLGYAVTNTTMTKRVGG